VNGDTVALIERPYQEIVDDVLTAVVGGIVNEPIVFDVKSDHYALSRPAADIRSITGTVTAVVDAATGRRAPVHHTFQKDVDYLFSDGDNNVVWLAGATQPDDETTFYVDYLRPDAASPLSDVNVGSVTRTLAEAIGREIATMYEEINETYRSGFIDTATGKSLDLVVSILDVHRKTKEYASGLVTFFRAPTGDGDVTIAAGTVVRTDKGEASFETAELRTLQRGQARIDVPVRALGVSRGPAGVVKAGAITTLARPILGIARITNFDATVLGADDETDEQLRARARAALRALGTATLAAILRAVADERASVLELWDPNAGLTKRSANGTIAVLVDAEPARFPGVRDAIEQTRAAGVRASVLAHYVFITPRLTVKANGGLTADGQLKVVDQVIAAMQGYVDSLGAGDPATGAGLLAAVKQVKDVSDPAFDDVTVFVSDVARAGTAAVVDTVLAHLPAIPTTPGADATGALRDALTAALAEAAPPPPTAAPVPRRDLLLGPGGARATDAEIAAGTFSVSATVDGDATWWIVLDAARADVAVRTA